MKEEKFVPIKRLARVRVIQSGKIYRVTLDGVTYKGTKEQIQKVIFDFNEGIKPVETTGAPIEFDLDKP